MVGLFQFTESPVWNDGLAGAPTGSPPFPTILNSYGTAGARTKSLQSGVQYQPPWNVAGVDYAVGIAPNASVNGNTITETGVTIAPTNGDKKAFYPQINSNWPSGGSLPSGITAGTLYFIINASGNTYQISTTSGGSAVTLGAQAGSFIALKDPNNTATLPAGITKFGTPSFQFEMTADNVMLDHWDFSQEGGWQVNNSSTQNAWTLINCYLLIGANANEPISINGYGSGATINNNVIDGAGLASSPADGLLTLAQVTGNIVIQYNILKNAYGHLMFPGAGNVNGSQGATNYTIQYNVLHNAGLTTDVTVHSDFFPTQQNSLYNSLTISFNTIWQDNNIPAGGGAQGLSLDGGSDGNSQINNFVASNNTAINTSSPTGGSGGGVQLTFFFRWTPQDLLNTGVFQNNFYDPTGFGSGQISRCQEKGSTTGALTGTATGSGNTNMVDGTLPSVLNGSL